MAWQVLSGRNPSPYERCEVDSDWRIAPLLRRLLNDMLNEDPHARPSALRLTEGLE